MEQTYAKLGGQIAPGYEPVAQLLSKQIQQYGGGAALCVYKEGEPVIDLWGGVRNSESDPWDSRTTCVAYSTSKGVLSSLLHWVMDKEDLHYSLPVCQLWPEFRAEGKKDITIRDLLSHEAGLHKIRPLVDCADRMLDWGYMTDRLANARPDGLGKQAYHGLTFGWLVGEVTRRLTGKLPGELLDSAFVEPMGLTGAMIGVPKRRLASVAQLVEKQVLDAPEGERKSSRRWRRWVKRGGGWLLGQSISMVINKQLIKDVLLPTGMKTFRFDAPDVMQAQIPAANGVFDARSLAKIYSMIAMGGEIDGKRYVSEQRIAEIGVQQNHGLDAVIPIPMGWRLGYHRVLNIKQSLASGVAHYGYGGSGAWGDPESGLSVGFVVNSGRGTPFGDYRLWQITHLLFQIVRGNR